MKIDSFLFLNEVDCLRIRFHELSNVVDKFVIAEFPVNLKGVQRGLLLPQLIEKDTELSSYKDKIIYLSLSYGDVLRRIGDFRNSYNMFKLMRSITWEWAQENLKDDDIFGYSDVDEIPKKYVYDLKYGKKVLMTKLYRYYFNLYFQDWGHAFIAKWGEIKNEPDLGELRLKANSWKRVENAGWHFSPVGNFEFIMNKYNTSSEIGRAKGNPDMINPKRIKERIKNRLHPFKDEDRVGEVVPMNEMPLYVILNKNKYKDLLL